MSILAVIPARLGATRLPQKPLRLLGGAPLVVRVWERVQAMNVADEIVVATDADDVRNVCERAGATVAMTRADHPSGTDRVAEVARRAEFAAHDVIVNVQGDEPFIPRDAVAGAAQMVTSGRFPVGTAAAADDAGILDEPSVVKVVFDDDARALYFSRAAIPHLRDAGDAASRDALVHRHIGVYAYARDALFKWVALPPHPLETTERLEQLRALAAGIPIGVAVLGRVDTCGIDTEADLVIANARWHDHTVHSG